MRESDEKTDRRDTNRAGERSTAEGETQEPAKAVEDENVGPNRGRDGTAVMGSEGSGEAPLDSRRKENA
jgi:hypothetical protein